MVERSLKWVPLLVAASTAMLLPVSSAPTSVESIRALVWEATDGGWADCVKDSYAYSGGPAPTADMETVRSSGGGSNAGTAWASGTGWAEADSGGGQTCSAH